MASEAEIKAEMKAYIDKHGGPDSSWYAGIAADPKDRLFNDHGVHEKGDVWIHHPCASADIARSVEDYLINTLGCDGGGGGGDENTTAVYAYKKSSHTDP